MKINRFFTRLFAIFLCMAFVMMYCSVSEADEANHMFLADKDQGSCTRLVGDVSMVVVFADVTDAGDDGRSFTEMKDLIASAIARLTEEASLYGKELSFNVDYYDISAEPYSIAEADAWVSSILETLKEIPSEDENYWVDRPLLICVNTDGRACATKKLDLSMPEYVVVFEESVTPEGAMHELLHLYGAQDFYLIGEVQKAADKFLPGSIMGTSQPDVKTDELTAYIIGWSEEPSENAKQFLNATSHLTQEDKNDALDQAWQSGLAVLHEETTTYRGMLKDGMNHEFGKMEWDDGGFYCGEWEWGHRTGKGTFHWPDGTIYAGDFVDGKMTGQGVMYWAGGTYYAGSFADDKMTGQGVLTYSSDGGYTGEFSDLNFHGEGIFVWPDGSVYIGDYADGIQCGEGFWMYADGRVYRGEILVGKYHGYGILVENNGSIYVGNFESGVKAGYGQMMYEDGNVVAGFFENDVLAYWEDGTPVE